MVTEQQKQSIIESGKQYFRQIIIPNHIKGLDKLHLKDFIINPFLINYLAAFLCGNTEPESLAKAIGLSTYSWHKHKYKFWTKHPNFHF